MASDAPNRIARVAVPLAVVGVLVAVKPEIVRGTFSSAESVLKVALIIGGFAVFSRVIGRFIVNPWMRTAVVGVPAAVVLFLTVLPYFQEENVDDPFPAVVAAADAPVSTTVPAAVAPATPTTTVPAGPVKLTTGQLRGLDGHRGSGEAAVYRQADGSLVVRLEEFNVSNTPGPVVYVVPGAGQDTPDGGTRLGPLRGSNGNQNFTVPAGTVLTPTSTVLIWCEPFGVAIAGATQTAA